MRLPFLFIPLAVWGVPSFYAFIRRSEATDSTSDQKANQRLDCLANINPRYLDNQKDNQKSMLVIKYLVNSLPASVFLFGAPQPV